MNSASLQKLKQELEAQEKQEFRNTMKEKVKDRVDTRGLPPYAKLNNKGIIECQICKFTTKDQMTFFNHVKTKKHQSAVEQLNRAQSQPQPKAQVQNQPVKNGKRPATHELYVDAEDFADEGPKPMPKPQQVSSLVGYQDDEDEEDIGPAPGAQPLQNVQNVSQKEGGMEKEDEEMGVGRSENKIEEDRIEEMVVEKPTAVPEGFFDKKEDAEEKRKREEMEKTMKDYKNFMEEIKKTGGEDADEILKELQGEQPPPLEEAEQEILDKVIKQDEEEIEDAHDYISNLRKRLGVKGKTDVQADKKIEDKNDKKKEKMEDEDDVGAGLRWKKRGLF